MTNLTKELITDAVHNYIYYINKGENGIHMIKVYFQ